MQRTLFSIFEDFSYKNKKLGTGNWNFLVTVSSFTFVISFAESNHLMRLPVKHCCGIIGEKTLRALEEVH
jgi:hypothetical protein